MISYQERISNLKAQYPNEEEEEEEEERSSSFPLQKEAGEPVKYLSYADRINNLDSTVPLPQMEERIIEPEVEKTPEQEAQDIDDRGEFNRLIAQYSSTKNESPSSTRRSLSINVEDISKPYSLDDVENKEHYLHSEWQERSQRFIEGLAELGQGSSLAKSGDIYEYLRDEKYSTTRAVMRAMQNNKWTPQMTEDYRWIRQVFDKAKLGGSRQILEATKDIAIDLLVDPMNLVTAAASIFTGGLGGAVVQTGARGIAALAGKQALAQATRTATRTIAATPLRATTANTLRAMSIGMTEGALDGSIINTATQISELQTGIRQEGNKFSVAELGMATGVGAILGAGVGAGVGAVGNSLARRSHSRAMGGSDVELPSTVLDRLSGKQRPTTPDDIRRIRKGAYTYNKFISSTLGKATSRYIQLSTKASPKLKALIEAVRYDAFKGILTKEQIDKVAQPSYAIRRDMREGKLRVMADYFMQKLDYRGTGLLGSHSFYNIKLDTLQNEHLFRLLSNEKLGVDLDTLYNKFYTTTPATAKTTVRGRLRENYERIPPFKIGEEAVDPRVIGAAFHIRKAFDQAHDQGSFIPLLGTDGKYSGAGSIFNYAKNKISNYLPRVWIYDKIQENRDILATKLVATRHANLYEGEFPTVRGRVVKSDSAPPLREEPIYDDMPVRSEEPMYDDMPVRSEEPMYDDMPVRSEEPIYDNMPELNEGREFNKQELDKFLETNGGTEDPDFNFVITGSKNKEGKWVEDATVNEELEFILTQQGDIDQQAFGKYFKTKKVNSFRELAELQNPDATTDEIETLARRLKAERLVDEMIEGKYSLDPSGSRSMAPDRTGYTRHRAFDELKDSDLYQLGVIETDVPALFDDYINKVSSSIERTALFGNNKIEFSQRWQQPIRDELEEAAKTNSAITPEMIREVVGEGPDRPSTGLMQLYTHITGLEHKTINNAFLRGVTDATKISMRLAYLPLATLSSITEPMIALSRADLPDTPAFIKAYASAAAMGTKRQFDKIFSVARVGISGKKINGLKDLSDEDWMEFYQAGMSAERAMHERMHGLYGQAHTKIGQTITNKFFQYNLLIPWTQAVQLGAYNFSNARITRILGDLNSGSNFMGQKLSPKAVTRRRKELQDIGVDPLEALTEYKKHILPEITLETSTPKGKAWARWDKTQRRIFVNNKELGLRYEEKAWTKPTLAGVDPLPENQFKTFEEFQNFVYSHERAHVRLLQRRNESRPAYENRMNREALANPTGTQVHSTFNKIGWNQSNYYDNSIIPASSLFSREIILNPSAAEANTPLWFNNPALQIFVQFMGYPTAFNNIVLKGMARGFVQNPLVNGSKIASATMLMTGTAGFMNAVRTYGESLELPPGEQVAEAVRRWGGGGPFEPLLQYREGRKYGGQGAAPIIKSYSGPMVGKTIDYFQYQQTVPEFFGTALPGYAALPPDTRKKFRNWLRQRALPGTWEATTGWRRTYKRDRFAGPGGYATGGVVRVANATSEPDERIDRITGLPYNMQAGEAYIDKEDRLGFAEGDLVEQEGEEELGELSDKEKARFKVKENEMYKLLTRDEEEYATLDPEEITIHSPESLNDLDLKEETFYASLPADSRKENLAAYRDSKTLGLVVSESPVEGNVRLKGRINFRNVLRLNVDEVTPATVEDKMSVVKAGNVLTKPYLADAIIDSMQYHLGVRDKVLEMDDELTKDKEDVLEQSKSFILRHGLLKLGYDAIKYNNGYVLLRENQFMPTEIMGSPSGLGRDARNRGGLMGSLKKQRASYDKGGAAVFGKFGGALLSVLKGKLEGQSEGEALYNTLAPRSTLPVVPNTSVRHGALHYNRKGITLPGAGDKGKGKGSLSAHFDPKNESVGLQFSQPFATGGKVEADEDRIELRDIPNAPLP